MLAGSSAAGEPAAPKVNEVADPALTTYRCVQSFTEGQKRRAKDKLLSARAEFRECSQGACPELTRKPCEEWLKELQVLVPTVSISATMADGTEISKVRATLDDSLGLGDVDATPIEIDPGPHRVKVEVLGFEAQERAFEIAAGTHELPLRFRFGSPGATDQAGEEGTSTAAAIGWTGVAFAAAGLVVGAVTGGLAMSNKAQLEDDCAARNCTQEDIDSGAIPATVSTVSFIVAGVGALVGIIGLAVDLSADEPAGGDASAATMRIGPGSLALRVRFP
jgi:hypothetical protein